jgi:hypothetical protein
MSDVVIRELLRVQLNSVSAWFETAWENVSYKPTINTPYQAVWLLPSETENPSYGGGIGQRLERRPGILQVSLFYPSNEGPENAAIRAEAIKAAFPRGLTLTSGSLRVLIMRSPFSSAGRPQGGWYMLPVSIPYVADVYS